MRMIFKIKRIKTFIDDFMINELLEEGGFNIFDEKNKVELYIPEIDLDDKIRKEFHIMSLWQQNLLTESEARKELGRDPYTDADRKLTYFELITKPRAIIQAVDEAYLAGGTLLTPGAIANKAIPANQFGGKKSGPTQRTGGDSSDSEFTDSIKSIDECVKKYHSLFMGQYDAALDDIKHVLDEESFNSGKIIVNLSRFFSHAYAKHVILKMRLLIYMLYIS